MMNVFCFFNQNALSYVFNTFGSFVVFFLFIFGDTEKRITSLCDIGSKTVEVSED